MFFASLEEAEYSGHSELKTERMGEATNNCHILCLKSKKSKFCFSSFFLKLTFRNLAWAYLARQAFEKPSFSGHVTSKKLMSKVLRSDCQYQYISFNHLNYSRVAEWVSQDTTLVNAILYLRFVSAFPFVHFCHTLQVSTCAY